MCARKRPVWTVSPRSRHAAEERAGGDGARIVDDVGHVGIEVGSDHLDVLESTGEGAHGRAKYYMHTGYREGQGGLVYPSLGAIASAELEIPPAIATFYGGTSLLITVSVCLDLVQKINSHLVMRNYPGLTED